MTTSRLNVHISHYLHSAFRHWHIFAAFVMLRSKGKYYKTLKSSQGPKDGKLGDNFRLCIVPGVKGGFLQIMIQIYWILGSQICFGYESCSSSCAFNDRKFSERPCGQRKPPDCGEEGKIRRPIPQSEDVRSETAGCLLALLHHDQVSSNLLHKLPTFFPVRNIQLARLLRVCCDPFGRL